MTVQRVAALPGDDRRCGRRHRRTATLWQWAKNNDENNDNKAQQEGEGGRGPGQLDARTSRGKRGAQWCNEWRRCRAEAQREWGEGGRVAGQCNAKQTNKRDAVGVCVLVSG